MRNRSWGKRVIVAPAVALLLGSLALWGSCVRRTIYCESDAACPTGYVCGPEDQCIPTENVVPDAGGGQDQGSMPDGAENTGSDGGMVDAGGIVPTQEVCSSGGFCWENPLPQGNHLISVSVISENEFWCGGGADLLHWDGTHFMRVPSGIEGAVRVIWAKGPNDIWASGVGPEQVIHYDGTSWKRITDNLRDPVNAIFSAPNGDLWFSSTQLIRYNGSNYFNMGFGQSSIRAAGGAHPSNVYFVGLNGTVLRWNGSQIQTITNPQIRVDNSFNGVYSWAPDGLHIIGNDTARDKLLLTLNGNWSTTTLDAEVRAIWGAGENDIWAVGLYGILRKTTESWRLFDLGPNAAPLLAIHGAGKTFVSVGEGGAILRWDGAAWSSLRRGTTTDLLGIYGQWNNLIAVGTGSGLRFDGARWSAFKTDSVYMGIGGAGADIWAVGLSGATGRWDGNAFVNVDSGVPDTLYGIWGSGANDLWAVGENRILHGDGSKWTSARNYQEPLRGIWGSAANAIWAVGGSTVLFFDGNSWQSRKNGMDGSAKDLTAVWGSGPNDVYVTDGSRAIWRWKGSAWTMMELPPSDAQGLKSIWGSGPNDVWAVGRNGEILHGDGVKFEKVDSGARRHLTGVFTVGGEVVVVGDGGTILRKK